MSGKALRILLFVTPLLAGCAILSPKPPVAPAQSKDIAAPAIRASGTETKVTPRRNDTRVRPSSSRPKPATTSPTPSTQASTAPFSSAPIIKPGAPTTQQPVPLFRQAIVLANVRAAVADLPAPPQAEFRQGLLTLKFRGANSDQIAAAVNRAMSVPDVARVQVVPAQ
jgi:hypothetical protein